MRTNRKSKFIFGLALFFLCISFITFGQASGNKQIQTVFAQLVMAYGSAKTAPQLIIVNDNPKQIPPAKYFPDPKPTIKVDAYLFTICRSFGKDSLNALSIVLSHELAHYYSDHTFCSDYAYVLQGKNKNLSDKLKGISKGEMMSKETEADQKGFFYAAAAGYSPFNMQSVLLDEIYAHYSLPDSVQGYPTRQERKIIAHASEEKANQLYTTFTAGLTAMEEQDYNNAIVDFETANSYIPFRENFNNIGVARSRKALELIKPDSIAKKHPGRFLYPIELDYSSRLNQDEDRGLDRDNQEEIDSLLKFARKDFQQAIRLDPGYTKSYINLACVFDLLGNSEAAIGTIKELPLEEQKSKDAQRILAIAYYHTGREKEAEEIWDELKIK